MEALGLERLQTHRGMRVPRVILADERFLLLEWIDFGPPGAAFQEEMGRALAETHLSCRGPAYGFDGDHWIGATPQKNLPRIKPVPGAWAEFWWTHRLEPMLRRLGDPDLKQAGRKLAGCLAERLPDPPGAPSLLHGDLWSGNVAADVEGRPVMFDPAPYYGHPEADLGMTRMFGGFTKSFYQAYTEVNPLDPGWQERLDMYLLYHVLNHAVLYGGGYLNQAWNLLGRFK